MTEQQWKELKEIENRLKLLVKELSSADKRECGIFYMRNTLESEDIENSKGIIGIESASLSRGVQTLMQDNDDVKMAVLLAVFRYITGDRLKTRSMDMEASIEEQIKQILKGD